MLTNYKRGIYKLQSALKNVSFAGFTNMNHSTSFYFIRLLFFRIDISIDADPNSGSFASKELNYFKQFRVEEWNPSLLVQQMLIITLPSTLK